MDTANERYADPKTIMVVDDELSVLTVVKCMLECDNYEVLVADNAAAALRMAANNDLRIDLLITDVIMPDVKGPDLAEQILALRPEIKVLFISGYSDSDVVCIKVLDGNWSFLAKPFTSDGLLESVTRVLNAPASCKPATAYNTLSQAF